LLSARAGEESTVEGLAEGADDYIVKPFAARELLARVRTHIELARMRADASRERERLTERERSRFASMFERAPAVMAVLRGRTSCSRRRTVLIAMPSADARSSAGNFTKRFRGGRQDYLTWLQEVYATGVPHIGTEARSLLARTPSGEPEEVFFNYVYQPLAGADGQVDGVLIHGFDVTQQVLARREIEELYAQVRDANETKMHFLAAMSHELRTPLTPFSICRSAHARRARRPRGRPAE